MTILHLAAENNNPDAIRTILDAGANPNALEISGISPLGTAALFCNVEAIEALNGRVDPNARNETNNTPIHWVGVFKYGNEAETLRALLRCGCDPRIVNSEGNSGVKELEKYGVEYEV
jgi:ankyrin repeat protein